MTAISVCRALRKFFLAFVRYIVYLDKFYDKKNREEKCVISVEKGP